MRKVTEIIEVVIEGGQIEKIVDFLMNILSNSTLKDYHISTDSSRIEMQSNEKLLISLNQSSDGSFYFNFLNFKLKSILFCRVGVQIIKFGHIFDLNLHIEKMEVSKKITVLELHSLIESISEDLKATNYYCGYEPAYDEKTRLFSGNRLGPLINWNNDHNY